MIPRLLRGDTRSGAGAVLKSADGELIVEMAAAWAMRGHEHRNPTQKHRNEHETVTRMNIESKWRAVV